MARLNTNEELWVAVSTFGIIRDAAAGGSTTLSAAASATDTTLTVADETGFAAGDYLRVSGGSGMEIHRIESATTGSITLKDQLVFDHLNGAAVEEVTKVDIGDITDDGVTRDTEVETSEVRAATQAGTYATLVTNVNGRVSANLLCHSLENVLLSLGIDEANIRGTGTAGDPYIADLTFNDIGTLANHACYFNGALNDGTTVEIHGWGVEFESNQSVTYIRGGTVSLPCAMKVSHLRYYVPSP